MILLLSFLFTIYGCAHVYVFSRIKAAFPLLTAPQQAGLILLMTFMVTAPILVRVSERYGYESAACLLAYIGYLWMGVLFLFFMISILIDLCRLLIHLTGRVIPISPSSLIPSPLYLFMVPLLVSTALNAYGFFEAKNIRTERLVLKSAKIPKEIGRIRIVQISDVHIGMIIRNERLEKIAEAVRLAEPDILLSTGDMLDGQLDNILPAADLLREIRPKFGKVAVTGNHEFFAGIGAALDFHQRAGFAVLRGEALTLAGVISIAGVDDATGQRFGQYRGGPEKELLAALPKETVNLLLKHRPDVEPDSLGLFDLQLSGHTHRGQIWPFIMFTKLVFPFHSGYYALPKGSHLYVSRGTGTWGPPVRFLAPPEVTVIDLIPEN